MNYEKALNALNTYNFLFHLNTCIDIDDEYGRHISSSITFLIYGTNKFDILTETDLSDPYLSETEAYFHRRFDSLVYFQKLGVIPSFTSENVNPDDVYPFSTLQIIAEEFEAIKEAFKKIYYKKFAKEHPVDSKFGCFLDNNEEVESKHDDNKILYRITFPLSNKIILNDLVVLSKPNLDSENAKVFTFLFEHPNTKFTKKQIEAHLGHSIGKSLHKIVENLGFKNDVRKLFFSVSENAILFRNPVENILLKELNVQPLRLTIQYKTESPA